MAHNADLVNAFSPKASGGIRVAPKGTPLPTDASTELDPAFVSLGYVSEDGVSREYSVDKEKIAAWGGNTVKQLTTSTEVNLSFSLIETSNLEALKFVYGNDAVNTEASEGEYVVDLGTAEAPEVVLVIDMYDKSAGNQARILVERAQVSELGEVSYQHGEISALETTVTALEGSDGQLIREFHKSGDVTDVVPEP